MLMKRALLVMVVGVGFIVAASAQEHTKDSLEQVKKAISAKTAVLIDVREKTEWDKGHLKDARLLPLSALKDDTLPKELLALLPKDKVVYAHCAAGVRCLKAAEILKKHGYDVRPLKDGYASMLKNGFPKEYYWRAEPRTGPVEQETHQPVPYGTRLAGLMCESSRR